jgi:quercetin dioxygenase-like cupin family protein
MFDRSPSWGEALIGSVPEDCRGGNRISVGARPARASGIPTEPAIGPLMAADGWPWPDALDALVAAPGNHLLMLENDRVRVLLTTIAVGATTPVHTHRWPSVEYIVGATSFVRRDAEGNVLFDTRATDAEPCAGDVLWSDPFPPHSLENVGDSELRVIMVELKQ